jgi:ketosteroid isomerase-like protein
VLPTSRWMRPRDNSPPVASLRVADRTDAPRQVGELVHVVVQVLVLVEGRGGLGGKRLDVGAGDQQGGGVGGRPERAVVAHEPRDDPGDAAEQAGASSPLPHIRTTCRRARSASGLPDVLPHGGTIRGREALGAYFGEVQGRWDDFRAELDDIVDGDARIVALGRFCGRPKANGRYVEVPFALVWTMRDRAAIRVDEYTDTALLLEALSATSPGAPA